MRRVREVIVVEGRYDKNALRQTVDATVLETKGFGVFKDRERLTLLRRLKAKLPQPPTTPKLWKVKSNVLMPKSPHLKLI